MSEDTTRAWEKADFCGGDLAVDFVNTVSGVGANRTRERLVRYADLVGWAAAAGILETDLAQEVSERAAQDAAAAASALDRALTFREALFAALDAIRTGEGVPAGVLPSINSILAGASAHRMLNDRGGRLVWHWSSEPSLDRPLWPVAQAAAALLTEGPMDRLRLCEATDCGWLFLDMSKNRSRRWCDMAVCGNRAKAARHYRRSRSG